MPREMQHDGDNETDSLSSFGGSPVHDTLKVKPAVRYAWSGNEKVDHDNFQRMLAEYRAAKEQEKHHVLKIKQLSAQLARTEEAAKRALLRSDPSARGGAAQKLLDAERAAQKLQEENAEFASKLAREKKKTRDLKAKGDEVSRRLDRALKEQRNLVEQLGRETRDVRRNRDTEHMSEESGRRFVRQQEELVALREENATLKMQVDEGQDQRGMQEVQAMVHELQKQVSWYQSKCEGKDLAAAAGAAGPSLEDWVLDEVQQDGQMFLLDATTRKIFTYASGNQYPRPVGTYSQQGSVQLGSQGRLEVLLAALDNHLSTSQQRLSDVWMQFDRDGSNGLNPRELAAFLQALLPDVSQADAEELGAVLDADGDGSVKREELLATAKDIAHLRDAAKSGRTAELNNALQRVKRVLQEQATQLATMFRDDGPDHTLTLRKAALVVCGLVQGATAKERRLLLLRLHLWDVHGSGRTSLPDLLAAMELRIPSRRKAQPAAGVSASVSVSDISRALGSKLQKQLPARPASAYAGSTAGGASGGGGAGGGVSASEEYLRDKVGKLEAELRAVRQHGASSKVDATQVAKLRTDLATAQERLKELEIDFLAFDPSHFRGMGDEADAALRQLKAQVVAYKKRYSEDHSELEVLKGMHSRVVEQLEATHAALQAESGARFRSEDEAARLRLEAQRVQALQESLNTERSARLKVERDVVALQSRALSAPSGALEEVRALREEVYRAGREKAAAQQKEAELRRELNNLRREVEGISAADYQRMQQTLSTAERRVTSLELELQAAREKLDVYRRTEGPQATFMEALRPYSPTKQPSSPKPPPPLPVAAQAAASKGDKPQLPAGGTGGAYHTGGGGGSGSGRTGGGAGEGLVSPDSEKGTEELRREVQQLRSVCMADKAEMNKLRKLLEHESEVVTEAKACEEAMRVEMEASRREMQQQVATARRQIDAKEEHIRKLEAQLRGAYSGLTKAVRTSRNVRTSLAPSEDSEAMRDLAPGENLLEIGITEASLEERHLPRDTPTFVTLDFYMHETQSSSVAPSPRPQYDTSLQYVLEVDPFFMHYLATGTMALELCTASGLDYEVVGAARVPLRMLLEDIRLGSGVGTAKAVHWVEVFGGQGELLGRVRISFAFKLPFDQSALRDQLRAAELQLEEEVDPRDPAVVAANKAMERPSAAAHVRVHILQCLDLHSQSAGTVAPYAHYRFPGSHQPHDTQVLQGANPMFDDECTFALVRTPELEADFRTREMEVVLFDDNGGDSPMHSVIGTARMPLQQLLLAAAPTAPFRLQLTHPITKQPTGIVEVAMQWCNPLLSAVDSPRFGAPRTASIMAPALTHATSFAIPGMMVGAAPTTQASSSGIQMMLGAAGQGGGRAASGSIGPAAAAAAGTPLLHESSSPPRSSRFAMEAVPRAAVLDFNLNSRQPAQPQTHQQQLTAAEFGLLSEQQQQKHHQQPAAGFGLFADQQSKQQPPPPAAGFALYTEQQPKQQQQQQQPSAAGFGLFAEQQPKQQQQPPPAAGFGLFAEQQPKEQPPLAAAGDGLYTEQQPKQHQQSPAAGYGLFS